MLGPHRSLAVGERGKAIGSHDAARASKTRKKRCPWLGFAPPMQCHDRATGPASAPAALPTQTTRQKSCALDKYIKSIVQVCYRASRINAHSASKVWPQVLHRSSGGVSAIETQQCRSPGSLRARLCWPA